MKEKNIEQQAETEKTEDKAPKNGRDTERLTEGREKAGEKTVGRRAREKRTGEL